MQVGLLGPLEVRDDTGGSIEVRGARARILLSLLALAAGKVVTGAWLIDRIWGDQPPPGAPNALQALVSRLRRRLPDNVVESHPAGYRLAVAPEAVDAHRFQRLAAAGAAALAGRPAQAAAVLDEALALWRGPALAGVADLPGGNSSPGWAATGFARAEAGRLEEARRRAIEDRAEAHLRLPRPAGQLYLGNGHHQLTDLETLVATSPSRERAAALLIRALAAAGRGGDALAAYERTRAALADRLGADPSPELAGLHRRLLRGDPELLASPAPAATAADSEPPPLTNLPASLTSFVGRDEDLARVGKLLGGSRLTTLTGPGGAGKTRLAVESARAAVGQLPDGVWLVELAPLTDPADLPHVLLGTVGLRDPVRITAGRGKVQVSDGNAAALARLEQALTGRAMLLVLDNCEHLVDAVAPLVERLLAACSQLRILATSREPLGITGEVLWPVGPLALPPPGADACDVHTSEAVRLLVDRAAAVQPGLIVDDSTAAELARICWALDGMPLAIELAAARLRTMTAAQLADRLDERLVRERSAPAPDGPGPPAGEVGNGSGGRFQVLTGGSRTALPRHQTLRAVVDWSWELLDPAEQALLRRLAHFSGGVTLAAAERVCGWGQAPAERVLDLLTSLVDKSLLLPCGDGEQPRYRMLTTIKVYGLARLAEAGEAEQVRRAHTAYFVALAETAEPLLRTGEQQPWLARLGADHENLQAALRSAIAHGEAETALRLVAALGWYWSLAGNRREALPLAAQALALPGDVPTHTRALAYAVTGCAAVEVVPEADVERWFQTAAQLAEQSDKRHPMLRLIGPMASMFQAWAWGRPTTPALALDQVLADPDPWVQATARSMRAHVTLNVAGYRPGLAEDVASALASYRLAGDGWGEAFALANAAELAVLTGDLAAAVGHLDQAVTRLSQLGVPEDKVLFQTRLAELRWTDGNRAGAAEALAAAQLTADQVGSPVMPAMVGRVRGELARHAGDLGTARAELAQAWTLAADSRSAELRSGLASALTHLAVAEDDRAAARGHAAAALAEALAASCGPLVARALVALADLALAQEQPDLAAQLLGACVAARGAPDPSLADTARIAAGASTALGEAGFAAAHASGRHPTPTVESVQDLARLTLGR